MQNGTLWEWSELSLTRFHESPWSHGMHVDILPYSSFRSLLSCLTFSPLAIYSLCSRDSLMGLDFVTSASIPYRRLRPVILIFPVVHVYEIKMEEIDSLGMRLLLLTVIPDQSLWVKTALARKIPLLIISWGSVPLRWQFLTHTTAAKDELGCSREWTSVILRSSINLKPTNLRLPIFLRFKALTPLQYFINAGSYSLKDIAGSILQTIRFLVF